MEKHIKESMNDEIVQKAKLLYDIDEINYFGGFENFIYMYEKDNQEYVLRFVHSDHKRFDYVLAEIEFIDYLAHHGASVSTVIHSQNDEIVERIKIDDFSYFSVSAFTRGKGESIGKQRQDPKTWEKIGEQIGLLHKLTKDFVPKHKRPMWQDDTLYQIADKVLVGEHLPILDALNNHIKKILEIPKHRDNYGLIHTDLHFGNMVMDDNFNLTFFDFDDASYKHFISDIAIVIFYPFMYSNSTFQEKNDRIVWILKNFFKGYNIHNYLPKEELSRLEDFLKLRELTLYTVLIASGEEVYGSEWGARFINTYRYKILNKEPFIDLDYVLNQLEY